MNCEHTRGMSSRGPADENGNYCTCHDGNPWHGECLVHAVALCPFREPLHCDKDGCPCCDMLDPEGAPVGRAFLRSLRREVSQLNAADCHVASVWHRERGNLRNAVVFQEWGAEWHCLSTVPDAEDIVLPEPTYAAANDDGSGPETDIPF